MLLSVLGRRVGLALVTLALVSALTFVATNAAPADPARVALGRTATAVQVEAYRDQQRLDQPVIHRYFSWGGNFLRGDWGVSPVYRREVKSEVVPRLARTGAIALIAMALAVPLAFLIGMFIGRRSGHPVDVGTSVVSLFITSLPEFVVGLVALTLFAVNLGLFPVTSGGAQFGEGWERYRAYALPILTLTAVITPYLTRMIRVNVREVSALSFVRAVTLTGVPERRVVWRHMAPNAALPVVGVIALNLAELLGGLVAVEVLFGFPGIGQLLVNSVLSADIPTVQAIALLIGAAFVALNFAADAIVLAMDPRART